MSEVTAASKRRFGGSYRATNAEVRLLYAACLCFIVAQYVVDDHPWNNGIRMMALLAMIAAQFIGFRSRRA